MNLINLIDLTDISFEPGQRWLVAGPASRLVQAKLPPTIQSSVLNQRLPATIPNLLLVEALSSQAEPLTWLAHLSQPLAQEGRLVIIDWQADGPPDVGPDLEERIKKGWLQRFLRDTLNFDQIETIKNRPTHYILRASQGPASPLPSPETFVEVARLSDLPKNQMKQVALHGQRIVIANTGKEIVAFAQACPHADGALEQGRLRGRHLACPEHGYIWNVHNGEPVMPEDEDTLPRYAVKLDREGDRVLVALKPPEKSS